MSPRIIVDGCVFIDFPPLFYRDCPFNRVPPPPTASALSVLPYGVRGRSASGQQLPAVHFHARRAAGAQEHAHAAEPHTCGLS